MRKIKIKCRLYIYLLLSLLLSVSFGCTAHKKSKESEKVEITQEEKTSDKSLKIKDTVSEIHTEKKSIFLDLEEFGIFVKPSDSTKQMAIINSKGEKTVFENAYIEIKNKLLKTTENNEKQTVKSSLKDLEFKKTESESNLDFSSEKQKEKDYKSKTNTFFSFGFWFWFWFILIVLFIIRVWKNRHKIPFLKNFNL